MIDAVVVGRVGIDLYPNELETPLREVSTYTRFVGGFAGNVVTGLARLGVRVAIVSRVGAEGLLLKPGADYVQAEEDAMADALVRAIRNPGEVLAMAEHGRRLVLDTYDWSVLAKKLEASWEKSVSCASST